MMNFITIERSHKVIRMLYHEDIQLQGKEPQVNLDSGKKQQGNVFVHVTEKST